MTWPAPSWYKLSSLEFSNMSHHLQAVSITRGGKSWQVRAGSQEPAPQCLSLRLSEFPCLENGDNSSAPPSGGPRQHSVSSYVQSTQDCLARRPCRQQLLLFLEVGWLGLRVCACFSFTRFGQRSLPLGGLRLSQLRTPVPPCRAAPSLLRLIT